MASPQLALDASTLKNFENAAAGHDGVLSDESGDLLIKPCTKAEVNFYQDTMASHPDFAELMPAFMGTLSLGAPALATDSQLASVLPANSHPQQGSSQHGKDQKPSHKIATETAIVLENLESGFQRPNVLDLKLGARLYEPGTPAEKAARLDKVAAETTSGSLNFRIAGMKVWNGQQYDVYDKFYGRKFSAENVSEGFNAFFASLSAPGIKTDDAMSLLETVLADVTKARHILERAESRMYGVSLLVVYEGDGAALDALMNEESKAPPAQEVERVPTAGELQQSEEDEEEEEDEPPVALQVRLIDFAHSAWKHGEGRDDNVIRGLRNVEKQLDLLIARFG